MRRHNLDPLAFVFGALFLSAAVVWGTGGVAHSLTRGWQVPGLLIAVGVIGVLSAAPWFRRR